MEPKLETEFRTILSGDVLIHLLLWLMCQNTELHLLLLMNQSLIIVPVFLCVWCDDRCHPGLHWRGADSDRPHCHSSYILHLPSRLPRHMGRSHRPGWKLSLHWFTNIHNWTENDLLPDSKLSFSLETFWVLQSVWMRIYNSWCITQVIGTAALLLCVLALGDKRNTYLPDGLQPVLVGAVVLIIGISMGSNSGYAINPARDIGPRFFTYIAGWGVDVFK